MSPVCKKKKYIYGQVSHDGLCSSIHNRTLIAAYEHYKCQTTHYFKTRARIHILL